MSKARKAASMAVIFALLLSFASFYVQHFALFTVFADIIDYYVKLDPFTYMRIQVLLALGFVLASLVLLIARLTAKKRGGGRRR